ncbi:MAG TPA: hypothetical protein VLA12_15885, partial [Planctomycetaceae bacterium]|nr:hypothetical protein [Planctomycetaceae bacterium]
PPDSDEPPSNKAGLKIFSPLESDDPDGEHQDENRTQDSSRESSDDASQGPDSSMDEKSIEASAELRRHLTSLKPLLVPGISEQQVFKVLSATAVFAEETLAAFLPLIGINPFFAYIDFRDMAEEINSQELKLESLRLHRRLDFEQK